MAQESALFIVRHETPVFGLGKIGPDFDLLLHTRESFSRSRKLRGHRPTVLFFHCVSRGARARDYQTAGVRDCCTRQMLSRHPNLLSRVPLLPLSLAPLPLETSHPVRRCLFLRAIPSSSPSNNSSRGIDREIPNASCHPIDSLLPWQFYQDGNIYTLVVDIFLFFFTFFNVNMMIEARCASSFENVCFESHGDGTGSSFRGSCHLDGSMQRDLEIAGLNTGFGRRMIRAENR